MSGEEEDPVTAYADDDATPRAGEAGMPSRGYAADKTSYERRLRRIEGQVRGIARMIDDDVYCIDVLTQVSAATKALQSVALALLSDHMDHCVRDAAAAGGPEAEAKLREANDAIARLVRS